MRDSSLGNPLTHSRKCSIKDCTPLPRLNNPLNGFLFIIEDNIYNSTICIWIQSCVTIRVSSGLGEWGRCQRLHMWRFRTSDHDTEHPPLPLLNVTVGRHSEQLPTVTRLIYSLLLVYAWCINICQQVTVVSTDWWQPWLSHKSKICASLTFSVVYLI